MKIDDITTSRKQLPDSRSRFQKKKEELGMQFEQMFARQLVQEMTKGLFEQDDKGMMSSGSSMYRNHIVGTLSKALANEKKLGMADMISKYWKKSAQESDITNLNSKEN